jgi:hypothetical protein
MFFVPFHPGVTGMSVPGKGVLAYYSMMDYYIYFQEGINALKYWICCQTVTLSREIACCRDNYHKTMKTFILLIDLV